LKPLEAHKDDPAFDDLMRVARARITNLANVVQVPSPRSLSNVFEASESVLNNLGGDVPQITST
jgi:hypothetical protein